ncbi:MAG TPA: 16S rRNA (cytosine(967)-C(5))-methyltransferase RsmB [Vicinamibacterales bacterium]|jgi:16S rRNA (cytosine967-C5)-methyltransferase|nr:16S rRNA (cytosine(967)-C(5))-methyltransferase RsmB [Vicinamibacterales bacterium]
MIAPARVAAYEILSAISGGRADLPSAIAHARPTLHDERDRALAAEIATGVQRWRAQLDFLITSFSKRTIQSLDPEIVEILRLSSYQLLHLSRVPAAAVVDDAVNFVGRVRKKSARGFVNAVLRSMSRQRSTLPLPARPSDAGSGGALDYLAITLSHPRWLAERWLDRLRFDTAEKWLQFNNQPAPVTLRANRIKTTAEDLRARLSRIDVETHAGRYAPDALIVDAGHPLRDPGHDAGAFVVQDEASQLVTLLAGANPGRLVLDTCASPGGKATAIAASLAQGARLVACDVRERRVELLRRTVRATGAEQVAIAQADVERPLPFTRAFNCVLVDAPCSGLGTLRRDPDIKWRRHEGELAGLAVAQLAMLRNAADVVADGGRLIYATCSSEPEENEHVAAAFLALRPDFRALDARRAHPLLPSDVVDARGHLRTTPSEHGLESFFGAVFERLSS